MKTPQLLNYERDRWVAGDGDLAEISSAIDGAPVAMTGSGGLDFGGDAAPRPRSRRPGAAQADLPRAGADDQGARPRDHGPQGRAVRAQLPDRRDPQGRLDRHRGRRRHALLLLVEGPPRASRRACPARRRSSRPVEERHLRRPAHLHPAAGRGGAHQRLQLPGLGNAREARADPARRRAGDREAGLGDRLSDRGRVPDHDRSRRAARRARSS